MTQDNTHKNIEDVWKAFEAGNQTQLFQCAVDFFDTRDYNNASDHIYYNYEDLIFHWSHLRNEDALIYIMLLHENNDFMKYFDEHSRRSEIIRYVVQTSLSRFHSMRGYTHALQKFIQAEMTDRMEWMTAASRVFKINEAVVRTSGSNQFYNLIIRMICEQLLEPSKFPTQKYSANLLNLFFSIICQRPEIVPQIEFKYRHALMPEFLNYGHNVDMLIQNSSNLFHNECFKDAVVLLKNKRTSVIEMVMSLLQDKISQDVLKYIVSAYVPHEHNNQ